ncbi:MAG: inositol oxygenase family protein [Verrucomicrobiota bacterium]|nr:inositol oxygenase family protein [Verrucomicrobiota bacterium]
MDFPESNFESMSTHAGIEAWEEDLLKRYPEKEEECSVSDDGTFRDYEAETRPEVREFYRLNHRHQTLEFAKQKKAQYLKFNQRSMTIWEGIEFLDQLIDDSDPDINLPQIEHLLQTAEAIRRDGHPRWFILTGLIHDLGKILCLFGEEQWAVVGDTFPLGCRFSNKIVFHEFFADNPDANVVEYSTRLGIYEEGCGLDNVTMSWGHDEYLYHVMKDRLPEPALYMIRYHSFYPAHREGEYNELMNDHDRQMFEWVRAFNPYDLYTKSEERVDVESLRPFYDDLINEYLPGKLSW